MVVVGGQCVCVGGRGGGGGYKLVHTAHCSQEMMVWSHCEWSFSPMKTSFRARTGRREDPSVIRSLWR